MLSGLLNAIGEEITWEPSPLTSVTVIAALPDVVEKVKLSVVVPLMIYGLALSIVIVPTVIGAFRVTVVGAVIIEPKAAVALATSGTVSGFQFAGVFHVLLSLTFQVDVAASV